MTHESAGLRRATVRTLKWNSIDRFSSQILYAITGIVLANVLPKEDFGMVNAIYIFQAFGILFVDSGFGAALLQKKEPSEADYSTVFWFNLGVSTLVYIFLFFFSPVIAHIFHDKIELIAMSRVTFLSFILNGLGIVQTNRMMKAMNVKQIAVANLVGLTLSGALGICLALSGAGAWALVWQTVSLAAIKTGWLWTTGSWTPAAIFSLSSLKSIYRVGLGVFSSSLLNTIFLQIYSFVIGAYYSLTALGIYSQADKWSKMGHASLSQIITATFVPVLARFQDDAEHFKQSCLRVGRICSFLTIPFMLGLTMMATPIFHTLFSNKWDEAIPLFQLLMLRGILVIYISLCTNYLLSMGYARSLVSVEIVKDVATIAAIFCTLPFGTIEALVWGQLIASIATYIYIMHRTSSATGLHVFMLATPQWRYVLPALPSLIAMGLLLLLPWPAIIVLLMQVAVGLAIYIAVLTMSSDAVMHEALKDLKGRFHR